MRHVFFVNNTTTYLCALAVIVSNKIAMDDVSLVTTREIKLKTRLPQWRFPFGHGQEFRPSIALSDRRASLAALDDFMREIDGDSYFLYLPKTSQHFFPLLCSSSHFVGFSLLEEGLATYRTKYKTTTGWSLKKTSVINKAILPLKRASNAGLGHLCFGHRYGGRKPFYAAGHSAAFHFNDLGFLELANRRKVSLSGAAQSAMNDYETNIPSNSDVIVPGLIKTDASGRIPQSAIQLGKHLHHMHNKGVQKVYIKAHPQQHNTYDAYNNIKINICPRGLELQELPPETVLEIEAYVNKSIRVHIDHSSFGIYAHTLGRHVERYNPFSQNDMLSKLFPDIPFSDTL